MARVVRSAVLVLLLLGVMVRADTQQRRQLNELARETLDALLEKDAQDVIQQYVDVKDKVAAQKKLKQLLLETLNAVDEEERQLEAGSTMRQDTANDVSNPESNTAQDGNMSVNKSALSPTTSQPSLADIQRQLSTLATNSNIFFMMINAIFIYFMQAGFALLECGAIRSKNVTTVLLKNFIDTIFCGIAYWIFGYALAFGGDPTPFSGTRFWAGESMDSAEYMKWFFQFTFACKTATIVAGAVAERCRVDGYMIYSFLMSAFIYPIQSHWAWDPAGWLFKGDGKVGFQDFAGSGVVHLCGGSIAFVAAAIIGPRLGRFENSERSAAITHHSVLLYALGGFILFVGFFAFNGASQQAIAGTLDGFVASNAVRNTVIAGSFASVTGLFVSKIMSRIRTGGYGRWSLFATVNAGLTGLVAICASCDKVHDWGAAVIGIIAASSYFFWSWLMIVIRVDDAVDAVAVHFGGGILGLILQPILKSNTPGTSASPDGPGLGWNIAGALSIVAWSVSTSLLIFGSLALCGRLRVAEEIEQQGLDYTEVEEECYPPAAFTGFSDVSDPIN